MTTIAAKVTNGKVKIAWDSQVTSGNSKSLGMNKVVKINDQFAVGIAGYLRFANIIHRTSVNKIHPFDLKQDDFDGYAWLLDDAVPAWQKAVKKELDNNPIVDSYEEYVPDGHCLIVLGGKLYTVGSDFAVSTRGDYASIGSGSDFANTAMHLGKTAKQAVEVATELDLYTGGNVKEMTV